MSTSATKLIDLVKSVIDTDGVFKASSVVGHALSEAIDDLEEALAAKDPERLIEVSTQVVVAHRIIKHLVGLARVTPETGEIQ